MRSKFSLLALAITPLLLVGTICASQPTDELAIFDQRYQHICHTLSERGAPQWTLGGLFNESTPEDPEPSEQQNTRANKVGALEAIAGFAAVHALQKYERSQPQDVFKTRLKPTSLINSFFGCDAKTREEKFKNRDFRTKEIFSINDQFSCIYSGGTMACISDENHTWLADITKAKGLYVDERDKKHDKKATVSKDGNWLLRSHDSEMSIGRLKTPKEDLMAKFIANSMLLPKGTFCTNFSFNSSHLVAISEQAQEKEENQQTACTKYTITTFGLGNADVPEKILSFDIPQKLTTQESLKPKTVAISSDGRHVATTLFTTTRYRMENIILLRLWDPKKEKQQVQISVIDRPTLLREKVREIPELEFTPDSKTLLAKLAGRYNWDSMDEGFVFAKVLGNDSEMRSMSRHFKPTDPFPAISYDSEHFILLEKRRHARGAYQDDFELVMRKISDGSLVATLVRRPYTQYGYDSELGDRIGIDQSGTKVFYRFQQGNYEQITINTPTTATEFAKKYELEYHEQMVRELNK